MMNLLFATILAISLNANIADITRAISAGDAETLGQYFDETVEVAVLDQEDMYNKARAVQIVKSFFASNQPSGFKEVHQGSSKGADSQYVIGNMTTSSGTFRVYIYMQVSGGDFRIQEIRFDQQ
jgi:hypothetical protein